MADPRLVVDLLSQQIIAILNRPDIRAKREAEGAALGQRTQMKLPRS
jgi:hypothetical protein